MLDKKYVEKFEEMFMLQYETCHRLDPTKLRNVSKFFGHLLHSDAISWGVLQVRFHWLKLLHVIAAVFPHKLKLTCSNVDESCVRSLSTLFRPSVQTTWRNVFVIVQTDVSHT